MRNIVNINKNWLFVKNTTDIAAKDGVQVDLPHSWNAEDGFDGGNDYFRGSCLYVKTLNKSELPAADRYYLEIRGANSSADVYVGTEKLAHHDGGYSTWRVDLTEKLGENTELAIIVDNSPNEEVYPQMADFTFYGGIYRNVNIICVNDSHFDLDYYGAPGIKVTPIVEGKDANVEVEVFVKNINRTNQEITFTATGDEDMKYYVSGVTEGTWEIYVDGVLVGTDEATEDGGFLYFEASAGEVTLKPVTE